MGKCTQTRYRGKFQLAKPRTLKAELKGPQKKRARARLWFGCRPLGGPQRGSAQGPSPGSKAHPSPALGTQGALSDGRKAGALLEAAAVGGGRQRAHLQAPRAGWAGWPRGRSFQVRGPGQGGVRPGTWRREGTDGCQGRAVHQHARLYQGAAQKRRDPQATGCAWCADGKTQKQKAKQKSLKTARTAPWAAEAAARRKVSKRTSDVPATFL